MSKKPRVAIVTNIAWNLFNFRQGLIQAFEENGYEPILFSSPDEKYVKILNDKGWKFVALENLERTGTNPISDLSLLSEFKKKYKEHDIQFALHYHAKPLVYGSIAAKQLGIPYVGTIAGLAGPFSGDRKLTAAIVKMLYRYSLKDAYKMVFQNSHDRAFFLENKIIENKNIEQVGGSGVNMDKFDCEQYGNPPSDKLVFFLFSRISWSKGIGYYVESAKAIKEKYPDRNIQFNLAGPFDDDNLAITPEQVQEWHDAGYINYLGVSDFIQKEISESHVIVYPSYYMEGVPRALLESASMSKPIITTNHVGCKEVVNDGINGYLIPTKNQEALTEAFDRFIQLSDEERAAMGKASRQLVYERFDENKVVAKYIEIVNEAIGDQKNRV